VNSWTKKTLLIFAKYATSSMKAMMKTNV